jgi:putative FmdB family regulatory protein
MPTYQYRCTECGHDLEAVQKFSDATLTECLNCGGRLRKVFNAVGVVFKGSGFYRNDSRKPDTNGDSSGNGDSKGSETKSDKPAKEPATAGASSSPSKSVGKKSASGEGSSTASKAPST